MSDPAPRLRPALMRLLVHDAGGDGASSEDLAAASGRLLDRVSQRLSVVIGRAGVEALFLRAVKLRRADFPFLDERTFSREQGESAADSLRVRLQEQEADVIREVSVTLVATVAGLLVTIIGERLAWSLLRDVWPETLRSEIEPEEAEA
jgi:hypothetical protein